jgi:peptide/nickel transport system substrate-binding protein
MRPAGRTILLSLLLLFPVPGLIAQGPRPAGTLTITAPREPPTPIPTLFRNDNANREVADLLFLRLADVGDRLSTTDERSFLPRLARRWERRDERTLVFDLDPRARWHDGTPVTARDAVFTFARAKGGAADPQLALLLRRIASVTAEGDRRVVVSFTAAYPEQMYDATYHLPLLPAHLVEGVPAESLATSAFAAKPVGNGPYRWVRRVPGQRIELEAVPDFFLGTPGIRRVLFLYAGDPEARVNLVLAGDADAIDRALEYQNPDRLLTLPSLRPATAPSLNVVYLGFNQRDPADTSRAHPILGDQAVRQALVQLLDRERVVRAVYGSRAAIPDAPLSQALALNVAPPPPWEYRPREALAALAALGWRPGPDGALAREGHPLRLTLIVPATSATRRQMAQQIQEQWRQLGIGLEVRLLEPSAYVPERMAGRFDLEFWSATQDPTPAGLAQSWSCAGIGGTNVLRYCDPAVDTLLARATLPGTDARRQWTAAARTIRDDAPAIFIAAPEMVALVHRRFTRVRVRPDSPWALVWQWRLVPGEALPRDRE